MNCRLDIIIQLPDRVNCQDIIFAKYPFGKYSDFINIIIFTFTDIAILGKPLNLIKNIRKALTHKSAIFFAVAAFFGKKNRDYVFGQPAFQKNPTFKHGVKIISGIIGFLNF